MNIETFDLVKTITIIVNIAGFAVYWYILRVNQKTLQLYREEIKNIRFEHNLRLGQMNTLIHEARQIFRSSQPFGEIRSSQPSGETGDRK